MRRSDWLRNSSRRCLRGSAAGGFRAFGNTHFLGRGRKGVLVHAGKEPMAGVSQDNPRKNQV